jgi:uncharacterized membrane protein
LLPALRRVAGVCLIALLIGMFIANVNAAQRGVTLRGKPPTALWLRGTDADFVYCATLVNSRLKGFSHRQADSKNFLICAQYFLTT